MICTCRPRRTSAPYACQLRWRSTAARAPIWLRQVLWPGSEARLAGSTTQLAGMRPAPPAPASAAGAAVALGLSVREVANAIALSIPGAGGVQRAFGTDAKSLQVGFAVESGIRAARLAAAGAEADLSVVDAWLPMVGGDPAALDLSGPAVPGGLAIKIYPCCYALQRPISALSEFVRPELRPETIRRIVIRTPESTVVPLIHHRPDSGLQGKFSLEYAAATALLDGYPGFTSFTDAAVRREAARQLIGKVEVILDPGGSWLLDGQLDAELYTSDGVVRRTSLQSPPGSPDRPPSSEQLKSKLAECTRGLETDPETWTWHNAAGTLRQFLPRPALLPASSRNRRHGRGRTEAEPTVLQPRTSGWCAMRRFELPGNRTRPRGSAVTAGPGGLAVCRAGAGRRKART